MILVLTGTQSIPFSRLIQSVLLFHYETNGENEIIIQAGRFHQDYGVVSNVEFFDFRSQKEIDELILESEIVITHGGTGSIISSLYKNKKVVVMPRLSHLGEHNDDHQSEIAVFFEKKGYVLHWKKGESLHKLLKKAENYTPVKYESEFDGLRKSIASCVEDFMHG